MEKITKTNKTLKEIARDIRMELKKEFPECKFSVRTEYYSMGQALHISLLSGNFQAITGKIVYDYENSIETPRIVACDKQYAQLSQFHLKDYSDGINNGVVLTIKAWEAMRRAYELTLKDNWDHSDPMTDYYSVNFALHLNIGCWDKPFTIV